MELFRFNNVSDVLVLGVQGELGIRNVRQLDQILDTISQRQTNKVVLDFSGLAHLDYKLVPHLVDRVVELQCNGGDLKLAAVSRYVVNILKAMGFEEEVYRSVEDAVLSFTPLPDEAWQ